MTLCSLCSSIPFNDLPQLPEAFRPHMNEWDLINDYYQMDKFDGEWWGIPQQPDLPALRSSAKECELFRLILQHIELVLAQFDKAIKENNYLLERHDPYINLDLCLAQRRVEGPGFLVLCKNAKVGGFYLVAAIGLAAKDGMISLKDL